MSDEQRNDLSEDNARTEPDLAAHEDDAGDPAAAFHALREAVEAYGEGHSAELVELRQDLVLALEQLRDAAMELDPSQEVGKIAQALSEVAERLEGIETSPLLKHGADHYARTIERSGESLVRNAVDRLDRSSGDLERITRQLTGHVESARGRRQQDRTVLVAGGIGVVLGMVAILILPWAMPATVGMTIAATSMNADRWDAGMALMKSGDPHTWNEFVDAHQLVRGNTPAIADCRAVAAKSGKEQKCAVIVPVPEKTP